MKKFTTPQLVIIIVFLTVIAFFIYRLIQKGRQYKITPLDEANWSPSILSEKFNEVYNSWKMSDEWDEPVVALMALNDEQFKLVHNDYNRRFQSSNGNKTLDEAIKGAFWISSDVLARYLERNKILYT